MVQLVILQGFEFVPRNMRVGGWFLGWFRAVLSLLVAMCPFGMPLVKTIWIRVV